MITIAEDTRVPIRSWAPDPDPETLAQTRHLASLPFAFRHVALMADAHVGYGMPIGGVLAAKGAVIPNAVGLDIGCGVRAWRTNLTVEEFLPVRDRALNDIQRNVPTGHEWRKRELAGDSLFARMPDLPHLRAQERRARQQLGTLGSGNHFIEVQRDPEGRVWAAVHSGSRNVGKRMAEHHNAVAKDLGEREGLTREVPPGWDLAYLPLGTPEAEEYLTVMGWCLDFALENRQAMMEVMHEAFLRALPRYDPGPPLDVHHNYAARETHFGEEVVVHRKGAIRAVGDVVIPGSMGTRSYIGRGLANPEAFESCAHGAGRRLGRREAKRSITVEHVILSLKEADIRLFKPKKSDVAEEAPEAYKDIGEVMAEQADLVEALVELTPLGVVKA